MSRETIAVCKRTAIGEISHENQLKNGATHHALYHSFHNSHLW